MSVNIMPANDLHNDRASNKLKRCYNMITLKDYQFKKLVAENETSALYIVRWTNGNPYKFYFKMKGCHSDSYESLVGVKDHWNNKLENFTKNAYDVAIGFYDYKGEHVLPEYPRNKTVIISDNERIAINTAIMLLSVS